MTLKSRRDFLRAAAQAAGSATALGIVPAGIRNALAIPANNRHGSIQDVEHIVVLMQENRSFDHYFGTLQGVRGFGDTRAVAAAEWQAGVQPADRREASAKCCRSVPARPISATSSSRICRTTGTAGKGAYDEGRYDQWVPYKGTTTMAYLTRQDIPFHYQLADAFTICDAYHCSINSSTDPNRYYMWTGWVGNDGNGGGPVIDNAEVGYSWSSYPEVLENANISWKIYQDMGTGLDANGSWGWTSDNPYIGNYGDNSLLYLNQYRNAQPGNPLYDKARTGTNARSRRRLLRHPQARRAKQRAAAGLMDCRARSVLRASELAGELWRVVRRPGAADPHVESGGVEQDGAADQLRRKRRFLRSRRAAVPALVRRQRQVHGQHRQRDLPGQHATYQAGPYGLGTRVPMLVVSPWSKGGYVCSELFDHTSVIQFIEKRFGSRPNVTESNITPWRRAICGDLTSAFNFKNSERCVPTLAGHERLRSDATDSSS